MSATDHYQAAPPPRAGEQVSLQYIPQPGLWGLAFKVYFLNIITLFIYSFWGKTNVRKHIWSSVHVMDEPLEYTGTGKELFLGFLIVTGLVILPVFLINTFGPIIFSQNPLALVFTQLFVFIIILYLIGVGIYRARRYRLSRTIWRGIRGTLTGSPWSFAWTNFWMTLLLPFTLLWSYPWMSMRLNSRMTNDMEFGSAPFRFAGPVGPLYARFAIVWVLMVVVLFGLPTLLQVSGQGIDLETLFGSAGDQPVPSEQTLIAILLLVYLVVPLVILLFAALQAIYIAAEMNYFAKCTAFENVRFEMRATALSLIGLVLGNFLIYIFTLGIGGPIVQQRLVRYLCDRLTPVGTLDVASIQQSQAELDRRGEGLAEVFDLDAF